MFALAPSKADQSGLRYWSRNRYKAHQNGVRWTNRAFCEKDAETGDAPYTKQSQIRLRHILMTEDQKSAVIRTTGSSPFIEKVFVPVPRGRSRTQVGRSVKK
jgi:hypothetical protein